MLFRSVIEADRVLVCAGAWTPKVPGLEALPIRPVRGQMVAIEAPGAVRHVIFGVGGYVVPRADEVVKGLRNAAP